MSRHYAPVTVSANVKAPNGTLSIWTRYKKRIKIGIIRFTSKNRKGNVAHQILTLCLLAYPDR